MKLSILAMALALGLSVTAVAAQPETASAQSFQFASTSELKSSSLLAVDAKSASIDVCWVTYSACMLSCGYYDPAQFPVDACSEACFGEYLSCAGF